MEFKKHIFYLLAIALLLFSCKAREKTATDVATPEKRELSEKERIDLEYLFFNANKEKLLGNYELAASLFLQCLRINSHNPAPMYELATIYNSQGNRDQALYFSKKAAEIDAKNIWYQQLYASILENSKKYTDAILVYQKLLKYYPERIDLYFELANVQLLANKIQDAIKTYDKIEDLTGITEETSIQKIKIYKTLNQKEKAIKELTKLIETFPKESKYYGMLGELYEASGMKEKALEVYNNLLKIDPQNAYVHLSLADYYRSLKEEDKAFTELKLAFSNPNLEIDTKVKILLSYYTASETFTDLKNQALELCEILIEAHPKEAKSYSIYGDFLYRDKKLQEARNAFRKAIELDKDKYALWEQVIIINSELNDFASMQIESKEAMDFFPTHPSLYFFNGYAYFQQKQYDTAIAVLNEGIKLVIDDKRLLTQFYATLGDAHYSKKEYAASDKAFDKALEADPQNVYVLNNYSYYLSLRMENLERAEAMSKKSNELDPKNSSYQDTYGWILYMKGNHNDAKIWLEKAIENGGKNNSVILEHYGDVLYKLNDKEKAFQFWKEAQQKGQGSELLEKKITDKKLYE